MFAYTKLMQAMAAAGVVSATDPYFNLVTLLLPGNGTNGAQNNTFLDSSSNNFTITRNGNTTQGTFSPFSQTGWSNYFNGSTDYLLAGNSADYTFGTGDFSISCWIYPTASATATTGFFGIGGAATGSFQIFTKFPTGGDNTLVINSTNNSTVVTTGVVNVNAWNYIAISRASGTLSVYLNGTRVANTSFNHNLSLADSVIGRTYYNLSQEYFAGYISDFRVVKGTALYSGTTITTPTTFSTAVTDTKLLTCQSNRFVDVNTQVTAKTITPNGSVSVQAFSPFAPTAAYSAATNGGSGYFDGAGDYVTAGAVTDWVFLNRFNVDFTISFWLFHPSASTPYGIISTGWNTTEVGFNIVVNNSGNNIITTFFNRGVSGSAASFDSSANLVPNAWNYVTITYTTSSKTVAFYINGAASGSGSNTGFAYSSSNPAFTLNVGRSIGGTAGSINNLNGYLSGLRILNGSIGSTTLPTEPPTNITNTSILLNFTNAGITDATAKNVLETVGNAQISTTQSKFGGSSMYFDGTGDALIDYDPAYLNSPGSGDWTFETWVYLNTLPGAFSALYHLKNDTSTATTVFIIEITSAGKLSLSTGTSLIVDGTSSLITTGSWTHVAVTRSSGTFRTFINGVQDKSVANTTTYNGTYDLFGVWRYSGSDNYLNGYMDDLRITKGYARYTTTFTPPTAAFALQ